MSEIDDIFGTKKKGAKKAKSTAASDSPIEASEPTSAATKKSALKRKKSGSEKGDISSTKHSEPLNKATAVAKKVKLTALTSVEPAVSDKAVQPVKKAAVETVDFRFAVPTVRPIPPKSKEGDVDDGFADSRGLKSGSRKSTDDGLRVFDNVELQIGNGNGDTPQCPFECWCCF
ncbi:hypothetical protein HDU77_002977 [Chytriomyces hyalinus]|nr:hypothetical protein HDU77_002977 [Chytriomyces hyalinus]